MVLWHCTCLCFSWFRDATLIYPRNSLPTVPRLSSVVVLYDACQLTRNLITVTYISTKLQTFVKHIETTCHAQEP